MSATVKGISSMATRAILADLVAAFARAGKGEVAIESIGGVDAAKRVRAGEAFDVVLLAEDALAKLEAEGHLVAGSRVGFTLSSLAVAIRAGAARPDFSDEAAVREAVRTAASIGYSTGPSGNHLLGLLKRWGIDEEVAPRLVQAPPGIPVGTLVGRGDAALGFQQLSELIGVPGTEIADALPASVGHVTPFCGAIATTAANREGAAAFLAFLASPETAAVKRRHGMEPG